MVNFHHLYRMRRRKRKLLGLGNLSLSLPSFPAHLETDTMSRVMPSRCFQPGTWKTLCGNNSRLQKKKKLLNLHLGPKEPILLTMQSYHIIYDVVSYCCLQDKPLTLGSSSLVK